MFIREILTDNPLGAAETIFEQNILGGMCARVCPTEAALRRRPACARRPKASRSRSAVLQRYATDAAMTANTQFFSAPRRAARASPWSAPARPALPPRTACRCTGHDVVIYDARPRPGGLNEYGIASYKTPGTASPRREVDYVTAIGGITIETRQGARPRLLAGRPHGLSSTRCSSAWALAASTRCAPRARTADGVDNAIDFIATLRQASDQAELPVGRRVVVIGGGMTAIDAAVQSKLLGAEEVTMVYRRGKEQMNASELRAGPRGIQGRHHPPLARAQARHRRRTARSPASSSTTWRSTRTARLKPTGETTTIACDQVFKAIGQTLATDGDGVACTLERQDRGRCRRPHLDGQASGPAATAPPAATTSP